MTKRNRTTVSLDEIIDMSIVILFSIYCLIPAYTEKIPFTTMLFIQFAYLIYVLGRERRYIQNKIIAFVLTAFFISACYLLLTNTSTISTGVSNYGVKRFLSKVSQVSNCFFPGLIAYRIKKHESGKMDKAIILLGGVLILFVAINTLKELQINNYVTRALAGEIDNKLKNIATYTYVYAVAVMVPALTHCCIELKKTAWGVFFSILIIFSFVFLVSVQYTLSLIIATITCIYTIIKNNKRIGIILFVLIPLSVVAFPYLLNSLSVVIGSSDISIRLKEISAFLQGESMGYNLNGRVTLYWKSIKAFLHSPIWGNRSLDFDGHASFLTVLSDLGLLGGIPYFTLYRSMKESIYRLLGQNGKKSFFSVYCALIMMGCTNPIHAAISLSFITWCYIPILLTWCEQKN